MRSIFIYIFSISMNKFEKGLYGIDHEKRKEIHYRLNMEEVNALKASENAEWVAKDFDRVFLKLLRMIRYTLAQNSREWDKLQQDTKNILEKFLNYMKHKMIERKWEIMQKYYFKDICGFVNFFHWDNYNTAVHNSIPNIDLRDYNGQSFGNQLFHNIYPRNWWVEWMCEWWSCSYWTILLYNFFNKLRESWIDMEIKFFRYKNLDDDIVWYPSNRHSWLMITFQWVDYMVDRDGFIYKRSMPIARPLQPLINYSKKHDSSKNIEFFKNFAHNKQNETDAVKFFDNVADFIDHCEKYPEYYVVHFYKEKGENEKPEHMDYAFWNCSFKIWECEYYLKDNDISEKNLMKDLSRKAFVKSVTEWVYETVTEEDKKFIRENLSLIQRIVDKHKLYDRYTSNGKRKGEFVDFFWQQQFMMLGEH